MFAHHALFVVAAVLASLAIGTHHAVNRRELSFLAGQALG
jgi:hypothetical protein